MRRCVINDCTGFKTIAPCCLDCVEHDCPDRCVKTDTTFCVGLIEERDDSERILTQIQMGKA